MRTNWLIIGSYLLFSRVLAWLTLFWFFYLSIYFGHLFFLQKHFVTNQFFREFVVTSAIRVYIEISELWVHLAYYYVYIPLPLTFKQCKFQSQTNIFLESTNHFSIKPAVKRVRITSKNTINFPSLKSPHRRLANKKKLISPPEKYFKTLKDIIPDTVGT